MRSGTTGRAPAAPDLVVVGHITEDVTPTGIWLGGVPSYAAAVAARLGLSAGIVTRCAPALDLTSIPEGVTVFRLASDFTTVMEQRDGGVMRSRAGSIAATDIPPAWRTAALALLGPVAGEVNPSIAAGFPRALIGATAQGWLRRVKASSEIEHGHVEDLCPRAFAGRVLLLTLSEEDLEGAAVPPAWLDSFPIVIVTAARLGLRLWEGGHWWRLPAFPARELDPTGAGDALAAAFLIRYAETHDVRDAARFGAATASFVVEGLGIAAAPDRAQVEQRLRAYPDIQLTAS